VASLYSNDYHFQTEWTGSGTKSAITRSRRSPRKGISSSSRSRHHRKQGEGLQAEEPREHRGAQHLAAGVAHEIRNPLTAIDIHTQLLKKGIDRGIIDVPEEVKNYLRIIDEEQRRLSGIVSEFLTAAASASSSAASRT